MRRWAVGALGLILVAGLVAAARAAEPEDDAPPAAAKSESNLFTRWFGFRAKTQGKKAPEKTAQKEATAPPALPMREAAAAQRGREEAALLRRQAVCLKLRMIAAQTNNEELRRNADQLDERAWNNYLQHTAQLPAGSAGASLDEATLDRHLGRGSHADGVPPAASRGLNEAGRAAARGELP